MTDLNKVVKELEALGIYDVKEVVYTIAGLALKEKGEVTELSEAKEKIDEVMVSSLVVHQKINISC